MNREAEILESNRAWIERTHPHLVFLFDSARESKQESLEWIETPSLFPSLRLGARTLHSTRDPRREAKRQIDSLHLNDGDGVVLFGAGVGYAALEALERVGSDGFVHWVETRAELLAAALAVVPLPDDSPLKIHHVHRPSELKDLPAEHRGHPLKIFVHEAELPLWGEEWVRFAERWEDAKRQERSSRRFAPVLKENLWANTERFLSAPGVAPLFGSRRGRSAVMAASGPSLDENLDALCKIAGRVTVIAVGSALRTLLCAGVDVDLGVITDPQEAVAGQIKMLPKEVPIVFFPTASRWTWDLFKGSALAAFAEGDGGEEWRPLREKKGELAAFGSVSTTALDLAVRLGAASVWIVGQDFCYSRGVTHTRGAVKPNEGRFVSRESVERDHSRSHGMVRTINGKGEAVVTHGNLLGYKRSFETYIARHSGVRFIQTSQSGLLIAGADHKPFSEILNETNGLSPKVELILPQRDEVRNEDQKRLRGVEI